MAGQDWESQSTDIKVSERKERFLFFFRKEFPFSQHHRPANFEIDGVEFNCAEQYMMYMKAVTFCDEESKEKILSTKEPPEQKKLGKLVANCDQDKWDSISEDVVTKGTRAKFSQNSDLKDKLFETFPKILVEASPFDRRWGIGRDRFDESIKDVKEWDGKNLLGFIITNVRNEMMKEEGKINETEFEKCKSEVCNLKEEVEKIYQEKVSSGYIDRKITKRHREERRIFNRYDQQYNKRHKWEENNSTKKSKLQRSQECPPRFKGRWKNKNRPVEDIRLDSLFGETTSGSKRTSQKRKKKWAVNQDDEYSDDIPYPQIWPNQNIPDEYQANDKEFKDLDFNLFLAGELETIDDDNITKREKRGRKIMLKRMVFYRHFHEEDEVLEFYKVWLKEVEMGDKWWDDDLCSFEENFWNGSTSGMSEEENCLDDHSDEADMGLQKNEPTNEEQIPQQEGIVINDGKENSLDDHANLRTDVDPGEHTAEEIPTKDEPLKNERKSSQERKHKTQNVQSSKVWFCGPYQHNNCPNEASEHTDYVQYREQCVHHICAKCYKIDRQQNQHPADSPSCPHKNEKESSQEGENETKRVWPARLQFCAPYQHFKCPCKASEHTSYKRNREQWVHHICAECYITDQQTKKHPADSPSCPHHENRGLLVCQPYQNNNCSKPSQHENMSGSQVYHFCATCWKWDRKKEHHPETSKSCPHRYSRRY